MPESLIKCIEAITNEDKRYGNMIFCDRNGNAMTDDDAAYDDGLEEYITAGVYDDNDNGPSNNGGPQFNSNNPPGIILERNIQEEQAQTAEYEEIPAILHDDEAAKADTDANEEIDKISGVDEIIEETPEKI
jgi:hypothetical protein